MILRISFLISLCAQNQTKIYFLLIATIQQGHRGRFKCVPNRDAENCHQYVPLSMF